MEIFIEESALSFKLAQNIIKSYPAKIISSYENFKWEKKPFPELISIGKKRLFLIHYKGNFFRNCPGTKAYFCCRYKIFHFGEGCPLDCSYCILQLYLNRPGLKIWANLIEDGLPELKKVLKEHKEKKQVLRIGTGEFADSLALESICNVSEILINFWQEVNPLAVLELKTKVALSENYFSKFYPDPRIIFAWSVNPEKIIKYEEKGTAPLEKRLESAKKAVKHGFTVAFHFDPIIFYEDAEKEYPLVLEKILNSVPLNKIAWISLGTLRYPKDLKVIAENRFPKTKIYSQEFIEGLDGKKRYFIDLRRKLYNSLKKIIDETKGLVTFYFCMEGERMWEEVLGKKITSSFQVKTLLDEVALNLCYDKTKRGGN
ncbi:MAG: DNA photolyase [Thermodesulfobacterium sp.]|nr:DNA photolyase [Thermodesulfobacterium sp.]